MHSDVWKIYGLTKSPGRVGLAGCQFGWARSPAPLASGVRRSRAQGHRYVTASLPARMCLPFVRPAWRSARQRCTKSSMTSPHVSIWSGFLTVSLIGFFQRVTINATDDFVAVTATKSLNCCWRGAATKIRQSKRVFPRFPLDRFGDSSATIADHVRGSGRDVGR